MLDRQVAGADVLAGAALVSGERENPAPCPWSLAQPLPQASGVDNRQSIRFFAWLIGAGRGGWSE